MDTAKQELYANGKIYQIECKTTGQYYIGSTVQTLAERLRQHIAYAHLKKCTSWRVLEANNFEMTLIEIWPCESKVELLIREGYHQQMALLKNDMFRSSIMSR